MTVAYVEAFPRDVLFVRDLGLVSVFEAVLIRSRVSVREAVETLLFQSEFELGGRRRKGFVELLLIEE